MGFNTVAIVIPAFNEATTIKEIIEDVRRFGSVVVVDDGSTDETAAIALKAGAIVVSQNRNQGYDCALNAGFKMAKKIGAKIAMSFDADGQHDVASIKKFIDAIENGADVVIGNRTHYQRISEYIFALYSRLRYGIDDPLCGMKAYSMALYSNLGHFDSYGSVGTELAFYAAKNGYAVIQYDLKVGTRLDRPRFGRVILGNIKILRSLFISIWKF